MNTKAYGSVSVINVDDGVKGDTGTSISGEREQWYLSTSKTDLAGGSWSDTEPDTIPDGRYLWGRIAFTMSDGTAQYSEAVYRSTISGIKNVTDMINNKIETKVWQSDITNSINTYDNETVQGIRDNVTSILTDIDGITSRVENTESTLTTKANDSTVSTLSSNVSEIAQKANKIELITTSAADSSSITLTDKAIDAITRQFRIVGTDGTTTIVEGGKAVLNAITANEITTENLIGANGWINLAQGTFNYGDALIWDGNQLTVSGEVNADSGYIGGWIIKDGGMTAEAIVDRFEEVDGQIVDAGSYASFVRIMPNTDFGGKVFSVEYDNGSGYDYVFYVQNNGKFYASDAEIVGGTIGGFTITDKYIESRATIDGTTYRGWLEKNSGLSTNYFWGVQVNGTSKAYVRYDGYFYANNANITGDITATRGTIGGWLISDTRLRSANTSMGSGGACLFLINELDKPFIAAQNENSEVTFRLSRDGKLTATDATITGDITATSLTAKNTYYIHNSSGAKKVAMTAPDASFGSSLDIGTGFTAVHINGRVITGMELIVGEDLTGSIQCGTIITNVGIRTYSNAYRIPIGSDNPDKYRVSQIASYTNSINIWAQWGDEGASFTARRLSVPSSDIRLKDNVANSEIDALSVINQIQMRQFDWKDRQEHWDVGFVADELEKIDPLLSIGGGTDEDGNPMYKSVNDFYLLGYLTKAVQELSAENDLLKTELENIKKENAEIKDMLQKLLSKTA